MKSPDGLAEGCGGALRCIGRGTCGPPVFVLHGGPGAPGGAAPLAVALSDVFRTFEPWQRGSGDVPLTVALHVKDLHDLIESRCPGERPALVGTSWGAMLALAYGAEHPDRVGPMVLVGCGTFDKHARAQGDAARRRRISDFLRSHPEHRADLDLSFEDQILKWHAMTDTYALVDDPPTSAGTFDARAFSETWNDMLRCQEEGVYPASFAAIKTPVLMLHGAYDPYPGRVIRDGLRQHHPQLEYREFERCGHDPWIEKQAREEFFAELRAWLGAATGMHPPASGE